MKDIYPAQNGSGNYLDIFRHLFICHTHDYNNYKKVYQKKKCRKKWRGGLKETIGLILIRPPQLQFLEDGTKIYGDGYKIISGGKLN